MENQRSNAKPQWDWQVLFLAGVDEERAAVTRWGVGDRLIKALRQDHRES
jgi:hypothetical protein